MPLFQPRQPRAAALALAALLVGNAPVHAQTAAPRSIAYLNLNASESDRLCMQQLRTGLEQAGWSFDQQLTLESIDAGGDPARIPALARTLAARNPAVLLATNNAETDALMKATQTVPIVVMGPTNIRPVLDAQLRPLANVTGVSLGFSGQFVLKPLEVLLQAFPQARRIGVITNSGNTAHERLKGLGSMEGPLAQAGIEGVRVRFSGEADMAGAWDELARQKVDAVMILPDSPAFFEAHARQALRVRLPTIAHHSWFATRHGGLLSYGSIGRVNMCGRGAQYVDQILRGRPLAELPVEELYDAALVVNLDTAQRLGITLPPALVARADRLIRPGEKTLAPTAEAGGDGITAAQPPTR
ncbi:MAG: hypothetical protein BGO13_12530 [Burkholderiales bacterium 66-5]|nr:MAG: hypothetical protein BGO13_12530 [Burkholderiales bacterium 66-5]